MLRALRSFAGIPWTAWTVLAVVVALIATASPMRRPPPLSEISITDIALYRAITASVQAGGDYYDIALSEQRAHGYPTRPAVTVREPTEAWLLAALRIDWLRRAVLIVLALFSVLLVHVALRRDGIGPATRVAGTILSTSGLVFLLNPAAPYLHEVWAGFFTMGAIAAWRPNHYASTVALALAACLFRETSAPVLLIMGTFALAERRWREAGTWCAAIVIFGLTIGLHLWFASHRSVPTDGLSPGWLAVGGWNFILATTKKNIVLSLLPRVWLGAVVALSLIGFAMTRGPWERRLGAVVLAYAGLFCFFGQPYNDYWGFLYAPLLPLGLAFAPRLLTSLLATPTRGLIMKLKM